MKKINPIPIAVLNIYPCSIQKEEERTPARPSYFLSVIKLLLYHHFFTILSLAMPLAVSTATV